MKLFYRPQDGWFGDAIPFFDRDKFYIFYLHDRRKTAVTADKTSWHLVTTKDFVHWNEEGCVLPAGEYDRPDAACYTGCVIKGRDGLYHMFYTGQNPENPAFCRDGKALQYILHAVSRDLLHWEKHYETAFGAKNPLFEQHDWRDPFVYYREDKKRYEMLLAARLTGHSFRRSGCVAVCRSEDLWSWDEGEVFFAPEMYYTHECPDLFCENGLWYLAYSTFTSRFATHYRVSDGPDGPWRLPADGQWDARGLYAVKTASDGERRYGFGWIPTRHGGDDRDYLEWGGNLAVHEIYQKENKELAVRLPDTIGRSFDAKIPSAPPVFYGAVTFSEDVLCFDAENTGWALYDGMPRRGLLTAEFIPDAGAADFGVGLQMDGGLDNGYFFRFEPLYHRVVFDLWPRGDINGEQHRMGGDLPHVSSFERPVGFDGPVRIQLLVEEDICILYVNEQTALSARVCSLRGKWGVFASGGRVRVKGLEWKGSMEGEETEAPGQSMEPEK